MQQILYAANIIFGGRLCPGEYISSEISLLLLIQRVMLNAENLGRIFAVACTRKKNVIYKYLICQYIILTGGELRF